jgi:ABC-type uncharacterized transport system substrate-binding protein
LPIFGTETHQGELLKEVAPRVTRAAVIRDSATPQGIGQFSAIQSLAPSLSLEVTPLNARDAGDIERAIAAVDRNPNSGLIVTGSNLALIHRELIVTLAARYKLPRGLSPGLLRRRRGVDFLWA